MAVSISQGLLAFRADHYNHGVGFCYNSNGTLLKQANATLINTVTPPYGTYCVELAMDVATFDARFVLCPKNPGADPSVGTRPACHIVFSLAANANPSAEVWIAMANNISGVGSFPGAALSTWGLARTTSGTLKLYVSNVVSNGTLTEAATGTTALATDSTFDDIEVIIAACLGGALQYVVRINGVTEINYVSRGGFGTSRMPVNIGFGDTNASSRGCRMYIHHVYGAYEDGEGDLLKPTIRTLYPVADSALQGFSETVAGTATAYNFSGPATLTDSGAPFTASGHVGCHVAMLGKYGTVTSNTTTVLTLDSWSGDPGATGAYTCSGLAGTGSATNLTSNWDDLVGGGAIDETNYNTSATTGGGVATSTADDLTANDVPYFVRVGGWIYATSTKAATPYGVIRESSTNAYEAFTPPSTAATWMGWPAGQCIHNARPGGSAWTEATVNAMEIGARVGLAASALMRFAALYAEVAVNANEANYGSMPHCPSLLIQRRKSMKAMINR